MRPLHRPICIRFGLIVIIISFFSFFLNRSMILAQDSIPCANIPIAGTIYTPGEVHILLDEGNEEIGNALLTASEEESTQIGIADFDSIGREFNLQGVFAKPSYSSVFKRGFVLFFPIETDLIPLLNLYCELAYIENASLDFAYETAIQDNGWKNIKKWIKDAQSKISSD